MGSSGKEETQETTQAPVETPKTERSWTNRLSFGLLDKPEKAAEGATTAPAASSTEAGDAAQ